MFKLVTSEDIKQLTKGSFGDEFDYLLDSILIPAVGRSFAHYCNRPDFDKAARTEFLSPNHGARFIFLASPPVSPAVVGPPAIEALRLYRDTGVPREYGAETELVNGQDFFVHENEGMVEARLFWAGGPKTIKVTYTGGYLTGDAQGAPEDLRLAAVMQVKLMFDRREEIGLTGRSMEGGSISMLSPLTLPKSVTIMLDAYRIERV